MYLWTILGAGGFGLGFLFAPAVMAAIFGWPSQESRVIWRFRKCVCCLCSPIHPWLQVASEICTRSYASAVLQIYLVYLHLIAKLCDGTGPYVWMGNGSNICHLYHR